MKRPYLLLAAPLLALGLTACDDYGYYGGGVRYSSYPQYGWYDGYYGSIHDGYWGNDGNYYYRFSDRDRQFRRGDREHFYRGDRSPGAHWRSMDRTYRRDYRHRW